MRALLLLVGAYHAVLGAFMVLAPRAFFDEVAPYAPYNDHFIRDIATFYLALGAAFVIAAARRRWRIPLLTLTLVQYALHVVNHVWDVADAEPAWLGAANLVVLVLVTGALWWLLARARERPSATPAPPRAS